MLEEHQVVFVHPCPEEGNVNMWLIVNVAIPPSVSFQGHHRQVIFPYVLLNIHAFSTALCGASTSIFSVLMAGFWNVRYGIHWLM